MASIFGIAQSVLEALRVDLHEWKRSPDLQERLQRCVARGEAFAVQEASPSHPAPSFQFRPLSTAPITCVVLSNQRKSRGSWGDVLGSNSSGGSESRDAPATEKKTQHAAVPSFPIPLPKKGEPQLPSKRTSQNRLIEQGRSAPSCSTSVLPLGAGPSRWESRLQLLSPGAQHLYAEMLYRGQTTLRSTDASASSLSPSASLLATQQWRRRAQGTRDAELRRAVRDYLYRMNILSCMENAVDLKGDGEDDHLPREATPVFADAVMNGTALCQLVATLLSAGDGPTHQQHEGKDAVPCRCPRTLEEVRVNYAQVLTALRSAPAAAQEHIPAAAWSLLPEDVFLKSAPTALLELFVHLIATYLPSPEELPAWQPQMCWQPSADCATPSSLFSVPSPAELVAAEADCCAFLHMYRVLPDPTLYSLPGPECLLPSPVNAPFMANWKSFVARTDAPTCLLTPSVWPYLCNGVLLVLLARRCGAEAVARATQDKSLGIFFPNPRTVSCCMANITSAFRSFQVVSTLKSSLSFFTANSVSAVLRGDRLHILSLLLHLREVIEGKASFLSSIQRRTEKKNKATPVRRSSSPSDTPLLTSWTLSTQQTPAIAAVSADETTSTPSHSSKVKRMTPATIAKGVARRYSLTAETEPVFSRSTSALSIHVDRAVGVAAPRSTTSAPVAQSGVHSTVQGKESNTNSNANSLLQWLGRLVGPDFRYTALDGTFSFDARHLTLTQPCFIFSDGVLLAHVIGLLECRRCDFLDCVQPAARKAAKFFNVRRCLDFLRLSVGVAFDRPLLDDALVSGDVEGVLSVLHTLRSHYGVTRKSTSFRGRENVLALSPAL